MIDRTGADEKMRRIKELMDVTGYEIRVVCSAMRLYYNNKKSDMSFWICFRI
jgi:hypothetical protein